MREKDQPIKLLLVEDNTGDALLVQGALDGLGPGRYHTVHARNLHEAVAALGRIRFDAVLMDLGLPESQGLASVEHMRSAVGGLPIVVLTGADDEDLGLEAVRRGAQDYLVKGRVDGRGIARAIRYALGRHLAEEALRQSEQRYRHLIEALPAAVYTCDREGNLTLYNDQAVRIWGRRPVLGKDKLWGVARLLGVDGRPLSLAHVPTARALREGRAVSGEEVIVERHDGTRVNVLSHPEPIVDSAGAVTGAVNVLIDITDLRRAQEDLRRLNDTLEQRVIERTALAKQRAAQLQALAVELTQAEQRERARLAQLLHDGLQQLLVAAKLRLGTLTMKKGPKSELAERIRQVEGMINQAITASRSLTMELNPPVLEVQGLAAALEWLGQWMPEKHNLKVEVQADRGAEPTSAEVRLLAFQAVRELLFNVIKHSGVDRAKVTMEPMADERLRIKVEDEGAGFDVSAWEARPTDRKPATADGHAHGKPGFALGPGGFGLFSVQQRLQLMGGQIDIQSAPGNGTSVTLIAPLHAPIPAAGVSGNAVAG